MSGVASLMAGGSLLLAVPVALAAGAISFASPCVLPLVPGYLSYVTGMSAVDAQDVEARKDAQTRAHEDGQEAEAGAGQTRTLTKTRTIVSAGRVLRGRTVLGATLFVLGFTAVFVSAGAAFGYAGANLIQHERVLEQVFGSLVILLGLFFAGAMPQRWSGWLQRDARLHYRPTAGLVGAPLLGMVFGIGWTPCLGPTLTAVQTLAWTQASAGRGAFLAAVYCIGLGLPFILTAVAFRRAMTAFGWIKQHYAAVTRIGGGMLVVVGAAMVSGAWDDLIHHVQGWVVGFNLPL
ncbi:cytochrome c biogenesis CcdA family protein [Actinocrinis sp.]|uniref:cytochrome c biogenesis CcdA family protein n=1 Tax=Actinocrinis sp. TaxID=1920516 RepID=UPI002D268298|nr:cytochrome c biogenesis protein CcdA [Actinocrinis sp.]HZP54571.1 cytochrome c biogenesis protein CcdA [Actinocrinis sp.]